MSDWDVPAEPAPGDPIAGFDPTDGFDASTGFDPTDGFDDGGFADPFADEIADVDASDWDADLIWGPDPVPDGPGDFDLPL